MRYRLSLLSTQSAQLIIEIW